MDDPEGYYKILKKDPLFCHFKKVTADKELPITLEDLHEAVKAVVLDDNIPKEVGEVFAMARQLYVLGYFNYRIFTVASHYGFLAIEAALVNKYKAAYGKAGPDLYRMIKKLTKDKVISEKQGETYQACRRLRNELSHLTKTKVTAPNVLFFHRAAELINNLYK